MITYDLTQNSEKDQDIISKAEKMENAGSSSTMAADDSVLVQAADGKYKKISKPDLQSELVTSDITGRLDQQDQKIDSILRQEVVPVDALPTTGIDKTKIYRLKGTNSYTDYQYDGSKWVALATYDFPGLDEKPTAGSSNLVTSGGVASELTALDLKVGEIEENKADSSSNGIIRLQDADDSFKIVDGKGFIGLIFGKDGLDVGKVTEHFRSIVTEGLFTESNAQGFADSNGYWALKVNQNGEVDLNISGNSLSKSIKANIDKLPILVKKELSGIQLPPYLFTFTNYCYSNNPNWHRSARNYAPKLYLDRLVSLKEDNFPPEVTFIGGTNLHRISPVLVSGNSGVMNITDRIIGSEYESKDISIPCYCSRNTNLIDKNVRLLAIGDSMTDADEWMTYMRKLALMDNIDHKIKTSTDTNVIDIKLIGTMRAPYNEKFTYRGESVSVINYDEGRSGWSCCNYLRHADGYSWNMGNRDYVAWDALGLHSKFGSYTGTQIQKDLIANTCTGYWQIDPEYIPIASSYTWSAYRGKIGYGSIAWADASDTQKAELVSYLDGSRSDGNILDNPINPFYSKDEVVLSNGDHAFSWDMYYSRYKNKEDDGTTATDKGTMAFNDSYVCNPNYVALNLGTNDNVYRSDYKVIMDDFYHLGEVIHAQIGCPTILFTPACAGAFYIGGNDFAENTIYNSNDQFNKNKYLIGKFGTLNEQIVNGVLYCPTYYVQRFGGFDGMSFQEIGEDSTSIGEMVISNDVHPNSGAYNDWGYELYSMLNYLNK